MYRSDRNDRKEKEIKRRLKHRNWSSPSSPHFAVCRDGDRGMRSPGQGSRLELFPIRSESCTTVIVEALVLLLCNANICDHVKCSQCQCSEFPPKRVNVTSLTRRRVPLPPPSSESPILPTSNIPIKQPPTWVSNVSILHCKLCRSYLTSFRARLDYSRARPRCDQAGRN